MKATDVLTLLAERDRLNDDEFIYAHYPESIKQALSSALTTHIAKYDITDNVEISQLSELVDDVAFNIEMTMKKNQHDRNRSKNNE